MWRDRRLALLADLAVLLGLGAWTWKLEARTFFHHSWLGIGWGDWVAHAYRVRFFDTWGLSTWDPDWDQGLPLFQGYQTLPHVLTAGLYHLAGTSIPHAMTYWTGALLLILPLSGYVFLRLSGCGLPGALLGAALLLDAADLIQPINDYSNLFGLALTPALFWVMTRALGTRAGWLGAVVLGISPYLHPYSSVFAGMALLGRLAARRGADLGRAFLAQLGVAAAVASFYWLPFLTSARPRYSDLYNWSVDFERHVFSHTGPLSLGLSWAVLAAAAATVVALLLRRLPANADLSASGLVAAAGLTAVALLALVGALPHQVMEIEPARFMPQVSVALSLAAAPLADAAWRRLGGTGTSWDGRRALAVALLALAAVASLVEGRAWYRSFSIPVTDDLALGRDLASWLPANSSPDHPVVIWADQPNLPFDSFRAFGLAHWAGDYIITRQWTVDQPTLNYVLDDPGPTAPAQTGDWSVVERFLRQWGIRYVYLNSYDPPNVSFVSGPLAGHLRIVARLQDGWVAEVPWAVNDAFTAPLADILATTTPDIVFSTDAQYAARDSLIEAFDRVRYADTSTPATLTWHSPEWVSADVAGGGPGLALLLPQNWDTVWQATAGGVSLPVRRAGPNYVAIDLGALPPGRAARVEIRHGLYPAWTISLWLAGIGLVVAAGATVWVSLRVRT